MMGIMAYGAYVPRRRLQRSAILAANGWFSPGLKSLSKGERAICNWDEDPITMAVEAARDCLFNVDRSTLSALTFASTTAPFSDRQNAVLISGALNLSDEVRTSDAGGGQRAGLGALLYALESGTRKPHLCVASDKRIARPGSDAEMINGDAAAAFLVGPGDPVARLISSHSVSIDFVDRFREQGSRFDYEWESRWVREEGYGRIGLEAVVRALEKSGLAPRDVDRFAFAAGMSGVARVLATKAGIRGEALQDDLSLSVGHAGVAQPLLMLVHALDAAAPGEKILVAAFGQGCDVLILEKLAPADRACSGLQAALGSRRVEDNSLRFLAFNGLIELERGMRAELDQKSLLSAAYRHRRTVLGLVGGRCRATGAIQFPRTRLSVAQGAANLDTQEDYPLADRKASILTFTADRLGYTPDPPAFYGMLEFEGGGRMNVDFTDASADEIDVGRTMRMMFRIKSIDEARSFTRYFWKAAPA